MRVLTSQVADATKFLESAIRITSKGHRLVLGAGDSYI